MEDRDRNNDRENIRNVENSKRAVSQRDAQPRSPFRDREPEERGEGEDRTATLNGKKGKIETEHTGPTGRTSAIPGNSNPGAERIDDEGTAASGAGLGGNKGTGTRNKKDFS